MGARTPSKPSSGFFMNSSSFCGKLQDDLGAIPTSFFVETTQALFRGHGNTGPWWYCQSYRSNMLPFFKFKHEKNKTKQTNKIARTSLRETVVNGFRQIFRQSYNLKHILSDNWPIGNQIERLLCLLIGRKTCQALASNPTFFQGKGRVVL